MACALWSSQLPFGSSPNVVLNVAVTDSEPENGAPLFVTPRI
jgi:hypothetical protein